MTVVIIGAGPAGLTVAERLRDNGVTGDVVMLSAEPFPPYAPPAMADFFLTGREQSMYWKGKDICDRLAVDFRPGVRVKAVQTDTKEVVVDKGPRIRYDKLVLASGSSLYAPIPGAELRGVFNFKSLTAATQLIDRVRHGKVETTVIVGAGFIGVEVALLLADLGVAVTMVEMMDRVMPRMLDGETARIVLGALQSRGVEVMLDTQAEAFDGTRRVRR
jgi:NADPH-dependent 2,4-dienoyl-CoA reductase/sulfur reductase-like enzyme